MPFDAEYFIKKLNLLPHPEGGFYREFYRCHETIESRCLPERFNKEHSISTAIYFMLKSGQYSKFHKHKSDELWHFYEGCPVYLYYFDDKGSLNKILLGRNPENGENFNCIVPAGSWMAATPALKDSFSLVACTVAPGFDFSELEVAGKMFLLKEFPDYPDIIEKLT